MGSLIVIYGADARDDSRFKYIRPEGIIGFGERKRSVTDSFYIRPFVGKRKADVNEIRSGWEKVIRDLISQSNNRKGIAQVFLQLVMLYARLHSAWQRAKIKKTKRSKREERYKRCSRLMYLFLRRVHEIDFPCILL